MKKSHKVLVSVTFDKPCTAREAAAMVRDCVHGTFYPTLAREKAPESFRIRGVGAAPAKTNDEAVAEYQAELKAQASRAQH